MAGRILAFDFAVNAHKEQQRRHGGGPYILHPIRVARAVSHLSENVVSAALLHDVIEDCGITPKRLRRLFGDEVASTVVMLTGNKEHQLRVAPSYSAAACAIKTADKTDNILEFLHGPESLEKTRAYAEHAYAVWLLMPFRDERLDAAFLLALRRAGVRLAVNA